MREFIEQINQQIEESLQIASKMNYKKYQHGNLKEVPMSRMLRNEVITNVLICGVGGSGIAGTIVANLFKDDVTLPIIVNKSYNIPNWVNDNTLIIISSYSGTTEETLSCLKESIAITNKIICITTGGSILALANEHNIEHVIIPSGYQPRAALIYYLVQMIDILSKQEIIRDRTIELNAAISLIEFEKLNITNEAKEVAKFLKSAMVHIYSDDKYEGLAVRFKQQLNENSKTLCSTSSLPEMNHNELVAVNAFGIESCKNNIRHLFLQTGYQNKDMLKRFEFVKLKLTERGIKHTTLNILGNNSIEKMIYTIHLSDWISYYLSVENNVDPNDVSIIGKLKEFIKAD